MCDGGLQMLVPLLPLLLLLLLLLLLAAGAAGSVAVVGSYSEDEDGVLWKCTSRNVTEDGRTGPGEVTCSCDGLNMTAIPAKMPRMHRL